MQQTVDYDPLDALIRAGHQHVIAERFEDARRCFEEVLARRPTHREALAGLEALELRGQSAPPSAPPIALDSEEVSVGIAPSMESKIVRLVRDKRYEDALEALYRAREANRDDAAVARSIRHIKTHLQRRYLRSIDLDAIPRLLDESPDDGDGAIVAGWIDGIGTYDDILQVSPLGRFRTLRALHRMLEDGMLDSVQPTQPTLPFERAVTPAPTSVLAQPVEPPVVTTLPSITKDLHEHRARRGWALPALALAAAAACAGWFGAEHLRGEQSELSVAPPALAAVPTLPASEATEPVAMIEVELETTPPGARAFFGERELGTTPLHIELDERHIDDRMTFRFELDDHVTKTVERTFGGRDVHVSTSLEPVELVEEVQQEAPRRQRARRRARRAEPSAPIGQLRGYKAEPY